MKNDKDDILVLLNNIKNLRKRFELSKKEMAKKLGISIYMLNKIESGILPPNLTVDIFFYIQDNFSIHPAKMFECCD